MANSSVYYALHQPTGANVKTPKQIFVIELEGENFITQASSPRGAIYQLGIAGKAGVRPWKFDAATDTWSTYEPWTRIYTRAKIYSMPKAMPLFVTAI